MHITIMENIQQKSREERFQEINEEILSLSCSDKIDMVDAIISYCETNQIDFEEISDVLCEKIKYLLMEDAIARNLMKKNDNNESLI